MTTEARDAVKEVSKAFFGHAVENAFVERLIQSALDQAYNNGVEDAAKSAESDGDTYGIYIAAKIRKLKRG